jgi:hypothetical protein
LYYFFESGALQADSRLLALLGMTGLFGIARLSRNDKQIPRAKKKALGMTIKLKD